MGHWMTWNRHKFAKRHAGHARVNHQTLRATPLGIGIWWRGATCPDDIGVRPGRPWNASRAGAMADLFTPRRAKLSWTMPINTPVGTLTRAGWPRHLSSLLPSCAEALVRPRNRLNAWCLLEKNSNDRVSLSAVGRKQWHSADAEIRAAPAGARLAAHCSQRRCSCLRSDESRLDE